MKLRLRQDPLKGIPGAAKQAKFAIKRILAGEDTLTIHVQPCGDHYIAWVEQCAEDEMGFCAHSDTPEHALWRLGNDFNRIINQARQ